MNADLALPGSVLVLKAISKLFAGHSPDRIDFVKAALSFPTDIAFLSFSFGAAVLYSAPDTAPLPGKGVVVFILFCVICAFVSTILSRVSEKAFDTDKNTVVIVASAVNYAMSAGLVTISLFAGQVI